MFRRGHATSAYAALTHPVAQAMCSGRPWRGTRAHGAAVLCLGATAGDGCGARQWFRLGQGGPGASPLFPVQPTRAGGVVAGA